MRILNKYVNLLIFTLFFFTAAIGYSQNKLQPEPNEELEKTAEETTEVWIKELGLTAKQARLMEKKIIEFAMQRYELVNSKMPEEEKTEKLKELQKLKSRDIRDILTKPQHERYLLIQRERIEGQSDKNKEETSG